MTQILFVAASGNEVSAAPGTETQPNFIAVGMIKFVFPPVPFPLAEE